MSLEIFVVFHKNIYDENYEELTQTERDCLTFVAVNEILPKEYDSSKYRVIEEWTLPQYHPELQQRLRFNENSVLRHVFENNLAKTDYIGFAQYDMKFPKGSIQEILDKITPAPPTERQPKEEHYFFAETMNYERTFYYTLNNALYIKNILIMEHLRGAYEQFRQRKSDRNLNFPILNTYILPTERYKQIMLLVVFLYKKYFEDQLFDHINLKDLGGIFERVMAFIIANEAAAAAQSNDSKHIHPIRVIHDHAQKH